MNHYIDKNIPLPNRNRGGVGTARTPSNSYPLADMQVGDSFLCTNRTQTKISPAVHQWARQQREPKPKFTIRDVQEGVRIWRVS